MGLLDRSLPQALMSWHYSMASVGMAGDKSARLDFIMSLSCTGVKELLFSCGIKVSPSQLIVAVVMSCYFSLAFSETMNEINFFSAQVYNSWASTLSHGMQCAQNNLLNE